MKIYKYKNRYYSDNLDQLHEIHEMHPDVGYGGDLLDLFYALERDGETHEGIEITYGEEDEDAAGSND